MATAKDKRRAAVEQEERKKRVEETDELEVNVGNLVEAISNQPALAHKWHDAVADAKAEVDRLEGALKLAEAKLFGKVRDNPSAYGIEAGNRAPGVDHIERAVIADDRYQAALGGLNEAKEKHDKIKAMAIAVDTKRKMLELLTSLTVVGFAGVEVKSPRGVRDAMNLEEQKRLAREMAEEEQ